MKLLVDLALDTAVGTVALSLVDSMILMNPSFITNLGIVCTCVPFSSLLFLNQSKPPKNPNAVRAVMTVPPPTIAMMEAIR